MDAIPRRKLYPAQLEGSLICGQQTLYGPWSKVETPMFTTNKTMLGTKSVESILGEFVTSGYFGGLAGDPDDGKTRVITQNRAGATYWVGEQANGSVFSPYWEKEGAVGYYDHGVLSMARTLGGPTNQVMTKGRKVLVGWLIGNTQSQSLPRDLSLSADYELLQKFAPELSSLRRDAILPSAKPSVGSLQMEIVADFPKAQGTFGVIVLTDNAGRGGVNLTIACEGDSCTATADASAQKQPTYTAPLTSSDNFHMHVIVDNNIIELIINSRTAFAMYANPPAQNTYFNVLGHGNVLAWKLASSATFS